MESPTHRGWCKRRRGHRAEPWAIPAVIRLGGGTSRVEWETNTEVGGEQKKVGESEGERDFLRRQLFIGLSRMEGFGDFWYPGEGWRVSWGKEVQRRFVGNISESLGCEGEQLMYLGGCEVKGSLFCMCFELTREGVPSPQAADWCRSVAC